MSDVGWDSTGKHEAQFGDYVELLKPRVMRLVVFTALVGMVAAPSLPNPVIALAALICVAVGAGASGALNMWTDYDLDAKMRRTIDRPIPSQRIERGEALAIGLGLSGFSVVFLGLFAGVLPAFLLAFTIFFYAVIYSLWLKRSTPQNIVIGGAAGAFPPMIGWAISTGSVSFESILMFLLIFLWTPPHFWALALFRRDDYEHAGVPMLPVVAGERATRTQILLYTLILVPVSLAPAATSIGGPLYLVGALILNVLFVRGAVTLWRRDEVTARKDRYAAEKRFFGLSIVYIFLLFALILAEAALRTLPLWPGPIVGGGM